MNSRGEVKIIASALGALRQDVIEAYPAEACGIALGDRGTDFRNASERSTTDRRLTESSSDQRGCEERTAYRIERMMSIRNATVIGAGRAYFEVDPLELYRAERLAEKEGLEIVGIYHSHPDKPAILSKEDVNYMIPGILYLVAAGTGDGIADIRGYVRDTPCGDVYEVNIQEEQEL